MARAEGPDELDRHPRAICGRLPIQVGWHLGGERFSRPLAPVAALLPAALFSALLVMMSVTNGSSLTVDARLLGVMVGAAAVWLRAPFVIVVVAAMLATAGLRLFV